MVQLITLKERITEVQEGGDVWVHTADSLHGAAEMNNIKQFYSKKNQTNKQKNQTLNKKN